MTLGDFFFEAARAVTREHVRDLGLPDPFPGEPESELRELARISLAHAEALLDPDAATKVVDLTAFRASRR